MCFTFCLQLSDDKIIYAELDLGDAKPVKIPSKYEPVEYAIIDPLKTKQMRTTLPPKQQSYESDV